MGKKISTILPLNILFIYIYGTNVIVCYILEGLVGVYDEENFNQTLSTEGPYRPHLRRILYSPNRGFINPKETQVNCKYKV